jgi:tRNA uridine 5-carbamoylmethylation protein Kti12
VEQDCVMVAGAVAAPLIACIKVLWTKIQTLQIERTSSLEDAARYDRAQRERVEELLRETIHHGR